MESPGLNGRSFTTTLDTGWWTSDSAAYTILVGSEGARMFDEVIRAYPLEEAKEKQEQSKTPGLWDLITIIKK